MRLYPGIQLLTIPDRATRSALGTIDTFLRDAARALSENQPAGEPALGAAPNNATFLTLTNTASLSAERRLTASAPLTLTDNGANNTATLSFSAAGLGGLPISTYATTEAAGAAVTFIRTDATLQFPQALMPTSGGTDTLTMTQSGTDTTLTWSNSGTKFLESGPGSGFSIRNTGGTGTVAFVAGTFGGHSTLMAPSWAGGTLADGSTVRCWDAIYSSPGGTWGNNVQINCFESTAFTLNASGAGTGRSAWWAKMRGPRLTTTSGSWAELGGFYVTRASEGALGSPTVTVGYGGKIEMPGIGTDQTGIEILDAGSETTATTRRGLHVKALTSGTTRLSFEGADAAIFENPSGRTQNVLTLNQLNTGATAGAHILFNDKAGDPSSLAAGQFWRNASKLKFYEGTLTHDLNPLTTKGDIIVHNGTIEIRLPVGTDGQQLTADSTQASGLKWDAAGGGGSGPEFADNVFRITDNTDTSKKIAWEVSGVTTATTRTRTAMDVNGGEVLEVANACIGSSNSNARPALKLVNSTGTDSVNVISAVATTTGNPARLVAAAAGTGDTNIGVSIESSGTTSDVTIIRGGHTTSSVVAMSSIGHHLFAGAMA